MEVTIRANPVIQFVDLKPGEVFVIPTDSDYVYMKIGRNVKYNAVNLDDGYLTDISPVQKIIKIKATVVIDPYWKGE